MCVFDGTYYKITTTNYISKTSLYTTCSIYHISHVSIGTLAAENLDFCTACDPWDSNIQLTMVKDWRPGPGMPSLDSDTCAEGGLFISARVFFPVWCHPWMDGKSFKTTTSFTICNIKSIDIVWMKSWKHWLCSRRGWLEIRTLNHLIKCYCTLNMFLCEMDCIRSIPFFVSHLENGLKVTFLLFHCVITSDNKNVLKLPSSVHNCWIET